VARPWWAGPSGVQVARWLSDYHRAVSDFTPPGGAVWREGATWRRGEIIPHNDAAPYNAVWDPNGLVGFVDWDMAGPQSVESHLAWVAFAWVPLHARSVVTSEGFTAFDERRARLDAFLDVYGWQGTTNEVLEVLARRLDQHVRMARATAEAGDAAYQRMVALGRDA
jgi:aminoglycoside phosphotransferase (APT) family kinase protein